MGGPGSNVAPLSLPVTIAWTAMTRMGPLSSQAHSAIAAKCVLEIEDDTRRFGNRTYQHTQRRPILNETLSLLITAERASGLRASLSVRIYLTGDTNIYTMYSYTTALNATRVRARARHGPRSHNKTWKPTTIYNDVRHSGVWKRAIML